MVQRSQTVTTNRHHVICCIINMQCDHFSDWVLSSQHPTLSLSNCFLVWYHLHLQLCLCAYLSIIDGPPSLQCCLLVSLSLCAFACLPPSFFPLSFASNLLKVSSSFNSLTIFITTI